MVLRFNQPILAYYCLATWQSVSLFQDFQVGNRIRTFRGRTDSGVVYLDHGAIKRIQVGANGLINDGMQTLDVFCFTQIWGFSQILESYERISNMFKSDITKIVKNCTDFG